MADKKTNKGLIGIVAAIVIAAGGVMAYMSQTADKSADKAPSAEVSAPAPSNEANDDTVTDPSKVMAAAGEEAPAQAGDIVVEPGNPVVARVDGKDITRVDVYRYIKSMPQNLQQLPAQTVYPLALDQTINARIVQNKANEAALAEDPEVQAQIDMAKQQIMRNVYLQREVGQKVSKGDIKKAYDEFISKTPDVEQRQASHILLETQEKAAEAIERLNKGEDFAALAKELSTGPTGPRGGDLGYFTKADMVPEFANVAFSLKKGAISKEPVKTQFGYHVIKVMDIRDQPKPSLEEMTPAIEAELNRAALEEMVKNWRKKAEIEQFDINGKPLEKGADVLGTGATDKAAE